MSINANAATPKNRRPHWLMRLFAVVLMIAAIPLVMGGTYLIMLGGSWYYALAGAAIAVSAWWTWRGEARGLLAYLLVFSLSVVWALLEVGLHFWALVPRIVAPLLLAAAALFLIPLVVEGQGGPRRARGYVMGGILAVLCLAVFAVQMFLPHDIIQNPLTITRGTMMASTAAMGDNWASYGRTTHGTRFVPVDQITPENVGTLKLAWTVRHGDIADLSAGKEEQNTPLYIDGTIYHCSTTDRVTAIKASTGKIQWQFDPHSVAPVWNRCRTLGYFDPGPGDACGPRIYVATIDKRLIAVRAADGKLCESFGNKGIADTAVGIGNSEPGFLMHTTGPLVADGKIVLGGWVADNMHVGEPSGVVRAWDALTGQLAWAWDLGDPSITKLPPPGKTYTPGTPNVWAPIAYDEVLNILYLPLGNATPDYFGGKRRPFDDEYNSSIVALDASTGRERWHYRTVNHDLWDYDLPAQPALIDFPDGNGGTMPALLQLTKRGRIFVLDRRTGSPLVDTVSKPAPQGDGTSNGEYYGKTQLFPDGMASVGTEPLSEKRMWGATPIDQMLCRISFLRHKYDGEFTPPSTRPGLQYPGFVGGFNWGSGAIDEERNLLIVNDIRIPTATRLVPRDEFKDDGAAPHAGVSPQVGLPYAHLEEMFLSPLGFPCVEPPMGTISAIDLATRKLVWQQPAGTMRDASIGNFQPHVPFYVGMPTLGGPVVTRGGLAFHAGTQDFYLRAYDVATGEVLWKGRLPAGAQATPMSFFDKESGKQFVVIAAGGASHNPNGRGDYIVAFSLP